MTLGDYVTMRFFGEPAISISMASGSGLFDQHRLVWDDPLLAALETGAGQLPGIVDRDRAFRGLRGEFAARLSALRDVPFYPALGDGPSVLTRPLVSRETEAREEAYFRREWNLAAERAVEGPAGLRDQFRALVFLDHSPEMTPL